MIAGLHAQAATIDEDRRAKDQLIERLVAEAKALDERLEAELTALEVDRRGKMS